MTAAPIHLAGERLMLDPAGALFWPATGLLAVSDLHLEKGSAFARKGMLLPPWDTHATLERLALLLRRYQPRIVLALGDSFHDAEGATRLPRGERARLRGDDPGPPLHLGAGQPRPRTAGRPGRRIRPRLRDHHAGLPPPRHRPRGTPERSAATTIRKRQCPPVAVRCPGPASWPTRSRLMLPAFGAYTGGLDVRDPAIARLFPRGARVFLLGKERLFSFTLGALRREPTG